MWPKTLLYQGEELLLVDHSVFSQSEVHQVFLAFWILVLQIWKVQCSKEFHSLLLRRVWWRPSLVLGWSLHIKNCKSQQISTVIIIHENIDTHYYAWLKSMDEFSNLDEKCTDRLVQASVNIAHLQDKLVVMLQQWSDERKCNGDRSRRFHIFCWIQSFVPIG